MLGDHLGPQESGQLAGDGDDRHLPALLAGMQAAEAATQPQLRLPRTGDDLGWQALLAAAQLQGGLGSMLVGPGRLDQLGAQLGVAALGDPPRQVELPLEYSLGVSPQNPMNWPALANRRQSPTSLANVNAPSRVTPRYALRRATASANGGWSYQVARSASIVSRAASRAVRVAR